MAAVVAAVAVVAVVAAVAVVAVTAVAPRRSQHRRVLFADTLHEGSALNYCSPPWTSRCTVRRCASAKRSAKRKVVPSGAPARTSADRPRPGPPVAHVADLHLSSESAPGLAASVGARKTITGASARGPGCSGAILALINRQLSPRLLHMLGMLRQGRQGMFNYPLAAESRLPPKLPRAGKPKPTTRARAASAATSDTDDRDAAPAPSSAASVSSTTSDLQGSVHSDAETGPLVLTVRLARG